MILIQVRFQWLKRDVIERVVTIQGSIVYIIYKKHNGPASLFIAQSYHKKWCDHNWPAMREGQWGPDFPNWFFSMMVCYCLSVPTCCSQGRDVTLWSLISTWLWQDDRLFVQTSRTSSKPSNAPGYYPIIGFLLRSTPITNIGVNARGWTESITFIWKKKIII